MINSYMLMQIPNVPGRRSFIVPDETAATGPPSAAMAQAAGTHAQSEQRRTSGSIHGPKPARARATGCASFWDLTTRRRYNWWRLESLIEAGDQDSCSVAGVVRLVVVVAGQWRVFDPYSFPLHRGRERLALSAAV